MKINSIIISLLLLTSCSAKKAVTSPDQPADLQVHDENDPIEPFNRAIFSFNNAVDDYLLEPVAKGYDYVLPTRVKLGVNNFFENLAWPLYFVSDVLQFKFTQAGEHTGRFLMNSTMGMGGLMDVAKDFGLPRHYEDLGVAVGNWGVDEGPYIMLPFFGPSNVRDGLCRIPQMFLNPIYYVDNTAVTTGLFVTDVVDTRRTLIDAIDAGKKGSLDYYAFIRNSFRQRRLSLIYDGNVPQDAQSEPADPLDDPDVSK